MKNTLVLCRQFNSIRFLSIRPPILLHYNVHLFGVLGFFVLFLKSLVYDLRKSAIGVSYRNKIYSYYLFALHFFYFLFFLFLHFRFSDVLQQPFL